DDRSDSPGGEDGLLVGEFALGLLDAAEHQRMARRIAADPGLRAELRFWQSRLARLDTGFAEKPAPDRVLDRVEARLFGSQAGTRPGRWWDSLGLWRGIAAGATAVAILSIGFNLLQPPRVDPTEFATQLVAALPAQGGSGIEVGARYDAASRRVRTTAPA